jgi:hypothetical protein
MLTSPASTPLPRLYDSNLPSPKILLPAGVALFIICILLWLPVKDPDISWFCLLVAWLYLRPLLICIVSFWLYNPAPKPAFPKYAANKDVTAILPTIDPNGPDFDECLRSCAENRPANIILVTAGDNLLDKTHTAVQPFA